MVDIPAPEIKTQMVTSPHGRMWTVAYRDGTTDLSIVGATNGLWGGPAFDEYALRSHVAIKGWALDIGAHVGAVALALAIDNPELKVIAVEAIPENCEVMRYSIELNGLEEQVIVVNAAANDRVSRNVGVRYGWMTAAGMDDDYVSHNRFVGNLLSNTADTARVPGVTLASLMDKYGVDRFSFMKIDCEGCEWKFLRSPAIDRVDEITGEWHFGGGMATVHEILDPTHAVIALEGNENVGLFRAMAR